MARLNQLTGALSGAVGPVVISSWRGIPYMKQKSDKPKSVSQKQLQHRAKMSLVSKFIYSMKELLDMSFAGYAIGKTGANAAFSYNFKNAVTGNYPAYTLDYSRILVSRGDLPNADAVAVRLAGDALQFNWTDNSGTGKAKPGDGCICIAFSATHGTSVYNKGTALRRDGHALLDLSSYKGGKVETWLAFISADGREVSDSIYTGRIIIP